MIKREKEKQKAIKLRKKGLSYSEILGIIPVSKSSLSLWLRSVGLSKKQEQRLTKKKLDSMRRGWEACRRKRILKTEKIKREAKKDIKRISDRELFLIGVALYWAEGSKERNKSTQVCLINSDPYLIKLFIKWLRRICKVSKKDIYLRIYLHETAKDRLSEINEYWAEVTGFPVKEFYKVVWKKHKINTKRKNIGNSYKGLLKVNVRRSVDLNRRIAGWTEGICKYCRVV